MTMKMTKTLMMTWVMMTVTVTMMMNVSNGQTTSINALTPKISLEILFTVGHIVLEMLVWRIWYWINYLSPD